MSIPDPIDAVRFWLHDEAAPYRFTDTHILEFLSHEPVPDEDGHLPTDDDWVPTYDILRAAGRGFLFLAGATGGATSYRLGDVEVKSERHFYLNRARELMGSACETVLRRDEAGAAYTKPSHR